MNNVKANPAKAAGLALIRDKNGNPKIDRDKLDEFWPYLSEADREYCKQQLEED